MAHYAYLDENNIVTLVIVGKNEDEEPGNWEEFYGAKRTSYNTKGGIYYESVTNQPAEDQTKAFRKNYAGIGYTYDENRDAFIPPKPFSSWILNDFSYLWEPPIPRPKDNNHYLWNEDTISWEIFIPPEINSTENQSIEEKT
jgi:hypothetical protein